MKKAVIYTRTAPPDTASNKKQEELCSQYARNNGYAVVSIYTDNGFPARTRIALLSENLWIPAKAKAGMSSSFPTVPASSANRPVSSDT